MRKYSGRGRRKRGVILLVLLLLLLGVVWILLHPPATLQRASYPLKYPDEIRAAGREYGVEPALIAGVIYTESRFNPDSESHRGAYGLMQILPPTAEFISERSGIQGNYQDPGVNIRMGTWYLSYLQEKYSGDERLVLAAYNSGEGQVDIWLSKDGFKIASDIPFPETRQYVENVLEARSVYIKLYGKDLNRG